MLALRQPQILKRIAITLTLGLAFIVMASIFSPDRSRANDPDRGSRRQRAFEATHQSIDAHEGLASLGVFETDHYTLTIYCTDAGPRYSIRSRTTGEELGTLLSIEQVHLLLPEVDLSSIDFSADPAGAHTLMLAEPHM